MVQSLHHDILQTLGARIAAIASMVVAEVCVSRMLGPDGRGSFALFLSSFALAEPLCSMGLPAAIIRTVARGTHPPSVMATWAILWGMAQGLIGCAVFYVLAVLIRPGFLHGLTSTAPFWMFLCLPSFLVAYYLGNVILGLRNPKLSNTFFVLQRGMFCLLAAGLYLTGRGTVDRVICVYSVSMFAGVILGVVYTYRSVGFALRVRGAGTTLVDLYGYGAGVQFGNIFEKFALRTDIFIINGFLGPHLLGYYSVARAAVDLLGHVPVSIARMLFPRVSHDPGQRTSASTARICRMLVMIQIGLGVSLALGVSIGIRLVLPKFIPSIPLIFILLPGTLGYALFQVLALDTLGRGGSLFYAGFSMFFFFLVVAGNLIFIPQLGVTGGALGTSFAGLLLGTALVITYGYLYSLSLATIVLPQRKDLSEFRNRFRHVP